jgi:peptide/nickel transport system permease protein
MRAFLESDLWRFARARPGMIFGFVVIVLNVLLALFGPALAPYPVEAPAGASLLPPGARHWFGTDVSGIDVPSRMMASPRIDPTIVLV